MVTFFLAAFRWKEHGVRGTRLAADIITTLSPRDKQPVNKQ
jgi:hypothetical protein